MPEIISKYQEANTAANPVIYSVPSKYGKQVLVNPDTQRERYDQYNTAQLRRGGAHRPGPDTTPFKAFSNADTGVFPAIQYVKDSSAYVPHPWKFKDKPSWKRSPRENWWARNRDTVKPFGITAFAGLMIMVGALLLAEFGAGKAGAATVASNPPAVTLGQFDWHPGLAQRGPCKVPPIVGDFLVPVSGVETLELRVPIQRCALQNIPVGNVSE